MKPKETPPVPITPGCLQWREVEFVDSSGHVRNQCRLLLIDTTSNRAFDGDFGVQIRCQLLSMFEIDGVISYQEQRPEYQVDIRIIRSNLNSLRSFRIAYSAFHQSTDIGWKELEFQDDPDNIYLIRRSSAESIIADTVIGNICDRKTMNEQEKRILRLKCGSNSETTLYLDFGDPMAENNCRGKLLDASLLGQILRGFVMHPAENGTYRQVKDSLSNNWNTPGMAAVKVIKHSLGSTPDSTSDLRSDPAYQKGENPMLEIEMIAMLTAAENCDESSCLCDETEVVVISLHRGHKNVVSLISVLGDEHFVYMIIPYYNGRSLNSVINDLKIERCRYTDLQTRECFRQVALAVLFCHQLGVCHLDISTENVMLHTLPDGTTRYILIDFGQALWHDKCNGNFQHLPARAPLTAPGKYAYCCPDTYMLPSKPYFGFSIDIWQLGMMVILGSTGSVPFGKPHLDIWMKFMKANALHRAKIEDPVSGAVTEFKNVVTEECFDFTQKALRFLPSDRITVQAMLAHPWLANP